MYIAEAQVEEGRYQCVRSIGLPVEIVVNIVVTSCVSSLGKASFRKVVSSFERSNHVLYGIVKFDDGSRKAVTLTGKDEEADMVWPDRNTGRREWRGVGEGGGRTSVSLNHVQAGAPSSTKNCVLPQAAVPASLVWWNKAVVGDAV